MQNTVCQSCGMPLKQDPQFKNKKIPSNQEYCSFCFDGKNFTQPQITKEEMRNQVIDIMKTKFKIPKFIGKFITRNLYKLKRWSN
jgi:hypothetical protein